MTSNVSETKESFKIEINYFPTIEQKILTAGLRNLVIDLFAQKNACLIRPASQINYINGN